MKSIFSAWLFALASVPSVFAAATLPSQLDLERGWDSADGRSYFVDADINLAGPRLFVGYGESDSQSGSTILNTSTTQLELSSNPLNDTAVAIGYSEWGQEGEINIKTYRLDLILNTDNWSFTLAPQTRRIELHTLVAMQPVLDIDSNGLNLALSFYGAAPFYLGVSYSVHDYSRDVSAFATYPILSLLFSPASLEYAYGFEKERLTGNMGVLLDWGSIGIDGTRSVSEVDNSVSTSVAASVRVNLGEHWIVTVRGGKSDNSFSSEKTTFGAVRLGYQF